MKPDDCTGPFPLESAQFVNRRHQGRHLVHFRSNILHQLLTISFLTSCCEVMNIDAPITADKVKDVDSADFFQMETKLNA